MLDHLHFAEKRDDCPFLRGGDATHGVHEVLGMNRQDAIQKSAPVVRDGSEDDALIAFQRATREKAALFELLYTVLASKRTHAEHGQTDV